MPSTTAHAITTGGDFGRWCGGNLGELGRKKDVETDIDYRKMEEADWTKSLRVRRGVFIKAQAKIFGLR